MNNVYLLMKRFSLVALFFTAALAGYAQSDTTAFLNHNEWPKSYRSVAYPREAIEAGIEGTVVIVFDVDTLRRITNKRIIQGIGYGCDENALKLIGDRIEFDLMRANKFKCHPGTMRVPFRFTMSR